MSVVIDVGDKTNKKKTAALLTDTSLGLRMKTLDKSPGMASEERRESHTLNPNWTKGTLNTMSC